LYRLTSSVSQAALYFESVFLTKWSDTWIWSNPCHFGLHWRIPNFKNFLSLHMFAQSLAAQSLAEQKHSLKISEYTFMIMCNHKTGYNWYSKMPKPTYTTQHPGLPRVIWVLRAKFDLGPLVIPSSNTMIRGSRSILPGKILKCEVPEMAKSCILEVCWQIYLCIFYCNSLFGPPLTEAPGKIAPSIPMGRGLDSTYSYNYLWQHTVVS
jgi:hypothetical protein